MIKLKRGQAPGLTAFRPAPCGTPRWRWVPAPGLRARGFKALILKGQPGEPMAQAGWAGLGFGAVPPGCEGLTLDGPPLGLGAAIDAARALNDAARNGPAAMDQLARGEALPPRPSPSMRTLNDWLDEFLTAAREGRVKTREKGSGKPVAIRPATVEGYAIALGPVRKVLGPDVPRDITRADLETLFEAIIDAGRHSQAVAAQRAVSRAMNWLRSKSPSAAALLPAPEIYSRMELGQPAGRLRMALPEEAEAMYQALLDPAGFARAHGLDMQDAPPARPGAAAAWALSLWTAQRGNDVVSFHDGAFRGGRLLWIQSKTGARVSIPLMDPALHALKLARATRAGLGISASATHPRCDIPRTSAGGRSPLRPSGPEASLLLYDSDCGLPYRQEKASGRVYYKRLNTHWTEARRFAGRAVPSLIGEAKDPFGQAIAPLCLSDGRDTAVTRLFEAMDFSEGALAPIASWHGSSVENLLKLLKHYLVLNPAFADRAGKSLEAYAIRMGIRV